MSSSKAPSRTSSQHSRKGSSAGHAPQNPSRLWQSHEPGSSPGDRMSSAPMPTGSTGEQSDLPRIEFDNDGIHPSTEHATPAFNTADMRIEGGIDEPSHHAVDAHTRLLDSYNRPKGCGKEDCNHGTFSPRPRTPRSAMSYDSQYSFGGRFDGSIGDGIGGSSDVTRGVFENAVTDGLLAREGGGKTMSTTAWLAKRHGVRNARSMYLSYYFPFLNWIRQYRWAYLQGDIIAALTMASFYIPMSLSYASNLGHIPPINGLYSFVFNPFVYALLGSCPQMVVGPEAAGSLLVGTVVRTSVDLGHSGDDDGLMNARIAGVVTGMAGAVIFVAGLTRLGFLDSVLSRPFLRGFISAIGFVILADQLIPELGLTQRAKEVGQVSHGSSYEKLVFLVSNASYAHKLTSAVAFGSFVIIMVCRELKRRLQPRYPSVAYIPDRFLVVVLSAVFTWKLGWDKRGLEILGNVQSSTGSPFPFKWPFIPSHMKHVREAMSTAFLIALLGFFESSVAAKSLGGGEGKYGEGLQNTSLSANRELVALGVANIVGGCFMALPAFGGYGRSKVNASTGGRTPMSSIILSLISLLCVLFVLPYFYYLPKSVLSSMISVVAFSLIEEAPHDIKFFLRIRGFSELTLMFLIFFSTIFYSLPLGIALGVGLSLLSVIRHSTKPRIQILGKVPSAGSTPGAPDQWENAEDNPQGLEFIEGCLIVKIPEPLTFANTGDLKSRLRRLELYGTTSAHPSLPRIRSASHNQNIIFDVHGVTGLDGSGAQVLAEIVDGYVERGVRVFFCRVPSERSAVWRKFERSGIIGKCGGKGHFVKSVDEALRMTELESLGERFRHHPEEGGG